MNAKEAVDKGFADSIMFQDEEQPQVMNAVGTTVVPKATLNKFRNMMMRLADKERPQKKRNPSQLFYYAKSYQFYEVIRMNIKDINAAWIEAGQKVDDLNAKITAALVDEEVSAEEIADMKAKRDDAVMRRIHSRIS